jgi:signal transduction histidine kinase
MSAVDSSRPAGGGDPSADGFQQLLRLCHDLRQYVAAGLLLSETSRGQPDEGAILGRLSMIHQQFSAIAELLKLEEADRRRIGGVNLTQLAGESADVARLTHRVPVILERSVRVMAQGDQALLRRAIGNLLDNACRAAGGLGTVRVRVSEADGDACVEVADDGPGFGDITSGTGLGLQAVAEAVRACAGRFEISSEPGVGTTIRICVPAAQRPVRPA